MSGVEQVLGLSHKLVVVFLLTLAKDTRKVPHLARERKHYE